MADRPRLSQGHFAAVEVTMDEALRTKTSPSGLEADTIRVLVRLFDTEADEDRNIKSMAREVAMPSSLLQYHLDRLREAGLIMERGESAYGPVYWTLTSGGRRYVGASMKPLV